MKVRVVVAALGALGALVRPGASQPAPGPAAPPEAIHGLRLEDAIQLAMTRNERAQIAQLNIVIAEAGVSRARSAFLPVLQATGNGTLHWRDTPVDTAQGALRFTQPLIDPTAWPLYGQAQHELSGQRAQSVDDRRQLAFDTAKAFIAVLLADQVVQAAQRKLDTARADLADTDAQARAQLVSTNDVTRARVGLGGSERELASDQGALDAAYLQLALLVKAPVAPGLVVPAELLDAGTRAPSPSDALVAQSLARRPDLTARKEAALAAHDFAREPRLRWLPSLDLVGQLDADAPANRSGDYVTGTVALSASWTIFDAGTRLADARSRDAQAAIAELTTDSLIRTIDVQVRSAAVALVSAQQALAAAQGAMDAARKSASETAVLYHQQLAKAIELLDANEQRFAAEVNFAEAQFSVASAYLALRQAMGLDPLGEPLP